MKSESIRGHSSSKPTTPVTSTSTPTTHTTDGEHPKVLMEDMKHHLSQGKEGMATMAVVMPPVMHSTQKHMKHFRRSCK